MKFHKVPISLAEANDFVSRFHRHHRKVQGHKFSIVAALDGKPPSGFPGDERYENEDNMRDILSMEIDRLVDEIKSKMGREST